MIGLDWQAELGGVTFGAGTAYTLTGPITGLGIPGPRTADQERGNEPGDVGGLDVWSRRVITVPLSLDDPDDPAGVWQMYEALKVAWAPTTVDVPFDLRLPGFGSVARRYYGRPRGLEEDLTYLRLGHVAALGTFEALDPFAYGPELSVALVDGETALVNPGWGPTDRYRLELETGNTATVELVTNFEAEPALYLSTLSGSGTVVLDGRARTVADGFGFDLYHHLDAGSGWPVLQPGENWFTLTGATGTLYYRPSYL